MHEKSFGTHLFNFISRNFLLVAGTTVATVVAAWLISVFIYVPQYTATSQVFIEPMVAEAVHDETGAGADYQTLEAYQLLAKSPAVLGEVRQDSATSYSLSELHDRISIHRPSNSQVLNIMVEADDKNEAAALANAVAFSLQKEVRQLLKVDNVSVILKAGTSSSALEESANGLGVLLSLAAAAGLLAGILLSLLAESMIFVGRHMHLGRKKSAHLQTVFK